MAKCSHSNTRIGLVMPLKPKDNPAPNYHKQVCIDCQQVRKIKREIIVTGLESWHKEGYDHTNN